MGHFNICYYCQLAQVVLVMGKYQSNLFVFKNSFVGRLFFISFSVHLFVKFMDRDVGECQEPARAITRQKMFPET